MCPAAPGYYLSSVIGKLTGTTSGAQNISLNHILLARTSTQHLNFSHIMLAWASTSTRLRHLGCTERKFQPHAAGLDIDVNEDVTPRAHRTQVSATICWPGRRRQRGCDTSGAQNASLSHILLAWTLTSTRMRHLGCAERQSLPHFANREAMQKVGQKPSKGAQGAGLLPDCENPISQL